MKFYNSIEGEWIHPLREVLGNSLGNRKSLFPGRMFNWSVPFWFPYYLRSRTIGIMIVNSSHDADRNFPWDTKSQIGKPFFGSLTGTRRASLSGRSLSTCHDTMGVARTSTSICTKLPLVLTVQVSSTPFRRLPPHRP